MGRFSSAFRNRLLSALLTATGVSLIAGGLLTFTGAAEVSTPSPSDVSLAPTPTISLPTFPPSSGSASASPSASLVVDRVATRVRIRSLRIDLPVIKEPDGDHPPCNVAMYYEFPGLGQPGQGISTYLYGHAQKGMFLPLLDASKRNKGESLKGTPVEVYTSDNQLFLYEIYEVRPRVASDSHFLDDPLAVTSETLWLQTSTGPGGQFPKLQVLAKPITVGPTTYEEAHPTPKPVAC